MLWLQALDDPAVVFSQGDPALLNLSYEVMLLDVEQAALDCVGRRTGAGGDTVQG